MLGAPCFEIPRSVERDSRFDHLRTGEALRRALAAKNRYNLRTIGVFFFTRWAGVFLFAVPYLAAGSYDTDLIAERWGDGPPLAPEDASVAAFVAKEARRAMRALVPALATGTSTSGAGNRGWGARARREAVDRRRSR